MDMSIPDVSDKTSKTSWFQLTKARIFALNLAGFLFVCAVFQCGYLYLELYYSHHHLDAGLFPKSTTDYFVYGGEALFSVVAQTLGSDRHSNVPLLFGAASVLAAGMAAYAFVLLSFFGLLEKGIRAASQQWTVVARLGKSATLLRNNRQAKAIALTSMSTLGAFAFLLIVCLAVVIYASIPTLIARSAARLQFNEEQNRFAGVCEKIKSDAEDVCMEVRDAKQQLIARGFIVASSPGYVALEERNHVQFVSLQDRVLEEYAP